MPFKSPSARNDWRREFMRQKRAECVPVLVPLHVRMGIATYVHRQAILTDTSENFGRKAFWSFDPVTRVGPNNHLFRQNVTLARMT